LLGLVKVWFIVDPNPGLAPVIPPVIAPMVQAKLLGVDASKLILVAEPLQMSAMFELIIIGSGSTVTLMV